MIRLAPRLMTTKSPLLTLNNGVQIPAIGLGVFQSSPEQTVSASRLASLLLLQILPVLHPTVQRTHGGDPRCAVVARQPGWRPGAARRNQHYN